MIITVYIADVVNTNHDIYGYAVRNIDRRIFLSMTFVWPSVIGAIRKKIGINQFISCSVWDDNRICLAGHRIFL